MIVSREILASSPPPSAVLLRRTGRLLRAKTFLNGLLKPVLAVQCRQGYRRRNAGSRRSRVVSDSSSFQV
jgi:hypothetical protein